MSATETVTAAVLVIGDEILSGRTKDKNIGTIADCLTEIGIQLKEVRIVGDDSDAIVEAINALRSRYSYVFTTGGIGPTHDDITAECVAKAFGVGIDVDPRAVDLMRPFYAKRGQELNAARLRMARIPDGADLITNSVSIAPGFVLENVIVMAGVPAIMEMMLRDATQQLRTGLKLNSVTVVVARPEADIADLFSDHQKAFPDIVMGSYPSFSDGKYRTELVLRGANPERLNEAERSLTKALKNKGLI